MIRFWATLGVAGALVLGVTASAQAPRPASLEACYLDVAARKGDPDAVYLAREICDAVFGRTPRSLTLLIEKSQECVEWWFDAEGRYESADQYCALTAAGEGSWKLACQWKSQGKPFTFVELREADGRLEPVGELRGKKLGRLFTNLGACIEFRALGGGG